MNKTYINQFTTAAKTQRQKHHTEKEKFKAKPSERRYTTKVLRNDDHPLQTLRHRKTDSDDYRRVQGDRRKT
eukprot:5336522-Amphidinium_carterae.2